MPLMYHEQTLFPLFNSSTILKELDVSLLHRTTSLRPGFFTSPSIPLLLLIHFAAKLVNILNSKFFFLPSFLVWMTKKGRRLSCIFFYHLCNSCTCIVYEYKYSFLSQLLSCVCKLCVFEIQSGFVIFPKRGRLLSCILCFSLFLLSCFGMILKPYLNLFFSRLFFG